MSLEVYKGIVEYLRTERSGLLATIVKRIGSSPRGEGATMFLGEDGTTFGTIGGGSLEREVKIRSESVFMEKKPDLFGYRLDAKSVEDEGMLCGGNVDVLIEPVLLGHLGIYEEAKKLLTERKKGVFYVKLKPNYSKSLFTSDGRLVGDALSEAERVLLEKNINAKKPIEVDISSFIIPLQVRSQLYVFGAGHVSKYLVKIASLVDFSVIVIDDSGEFAKKENFPDAEAVYAVPFEESFDLLSFTGEEYVVIVTRGHKSDTLCLEEVLKRPFRYVGMIGSKRKVRAVFEYLRAKGYDEALLKRVHAPIGIEINSETPQEVAVSIVAELIKERGEYFRNVR
ncbi:MAG: XdhC family protein [Desulfobacterota bacterium]|nr:XdhC family protein [Thermodesulfobacteriota bacterium]MDW8002280.1 XdhC family protein [Deltaproteobacteria bacterium]